MLKSSSTLPAYVNRKYPEPGMRIFVLNSDLELTQAVVLAQLTRG